MRESKIPFGIIEVGKGVSEVSGDRITFIAAIVAVMCVLEEGVVRSISRRVRWGCWGFCLWRGGKGVVI